MSRRRRLPNPWVALPSLVLGLLAGWITYLVMDVSCRVEVEGAVESCTGLAVGLAVAIFAGATFGVAVVLVLAYRSIAEYREAQAAGRPPPEPGCETGPE